MAKILIVIAPQDYRDEEFEIPKAVFLTADHDVVVASKGVVTANGMLGGETDVDLDIEEAEAEDYEALVFVGGAGASIYFDDKKAHRLVQQMHRAGKVVGAICIAPSILANADILKGKEATSFPSEKENLTNRGASFSGNPVCIDGKIVTASGPEVSEDFAKAMIDVLPSSEQ